MPCGYPYYAATLFWSSGTMLRHLFFYLKNSFNMINHLIWPDFCGPWVTGLMGFFCTDIYFFNDKKVVSMSPKQYRSFVNYVTFESLYSTWFHKKSSNKAIHALDVTSNKIVIKLFRYCSIVSVYGIANALNTLFKTETGQKSVHSTYKTLIYRSYKKEREKIFNSIQFKGARSRYFRQFQH